MNERINKIYEWDNSQNICKIVVGKVMINSSPSNIFQSILLLGRFFESKHLAIWNAIGYRLALHPKDIYGMSNSARKKF